MLVSLSSGYGSNDLALGESVMRRLATLASAAVVLFGVMALGERPAVTEPRATSGDTAVEPDWQQKLTITVGPKGELEGSTDKVIQAGVDYVARLGGGTVKILPGTYRLRNSIFLQSNVRLLGSGTDTVLFKEPSATTRLAADSDWYDQEITLENADAFQVGDGITLRARGDGKRYDTYVKRTLVARTQKRFKLDRPLRDNFWRLGNAVAMSVFPLVTGENIADAVVEVVTHSNGVDDIDLGISHPNSCHLDIKYAVFCSKKKIQTSHIQ